MLITKLTEISKPFTQLHISRSLGNRTIITDSREWRNLRKKVISNYKLTCRFCGTKANKGIICDHLDGDGSNNTMYKFILNCPDCYIIRHCGRGNVCKTLVFHKSNMDQVDIVKCHYDHYLNYGEFAPKPELIGLYCQIIANHQIKVNNKIMLHI